MVQNRRKKTRLGQNLTMGEHNLEVEQEFSYLVAKLTNNNDEETEIQKRIVAATRNYHSSASNPKVEKHPHKD